MHITNKTKISAFTSAAHLASASYSSDDSRMMGKVSDVVKDDIAIVSDGTIDERRQVAPTTRPWTPRFFVPPGIS